MVAPVNDSSAIAVAPGHARAVLARCSSRFSVPFSHRCRQFRCRRVLTHSIEIRSDRLSATQSRRPCRASAMPKPSQTRTGHERIGGNPAVMRVVPRHDQVAGSRVGPRCRAGQVKKPGNDLPIVSDVEVFFAPSSRPHHGRMPGRSPWHRGRRARLDPRRWRFRPAGLCGPGRRAGLQSG